MTLRESDRQAIEKALAALNKAVWDAGLDEAAPGHLGYLAQEPGIRRMVCLFYTVDRDLSPEGTATDGNGYSQAKALDFAVPVAGEPEPREDHTELQPTPERAGEVPEEMITEAALEKPVPSPTEQAVQLGVSDGASLTPALGRQAVKLHPPVTVATEPMHEMPSDELPTRPATLKMSDRPAPAASIGGTKTLEEQSEKVAKSVSPEAAISMNAEKAYRTGAIAQESGAKAGFAPAHQTKPKLLAQAVPATAPAMSAVAPVPSTPPRLVKKNISLKNARAGEPYEALLEIEGLKDIHLEDDASTGIAINGSGRLAGKPGEAGDFVLKITGFLNGVRYEISANLAVIPDPKSLWTSQPSDRSAPYWKNDQAFDRTENGDLLCVAASKRGRSHAKDGTSRDDDFALFDERPGGWHIAVVADGAGSAKYSRYGSELAVKTVISGLPALLEQVVAPQLERFVDLHLQGNPEAERQIKAQLLYTSLATVAFNAAKAIEDEAAIKNERVSVYSTTLIIGVARKVRDLWFIAGFAIGDGGMAILDVADRSLKPMSVPDSGEYAGQTRFLHKSEFANYEDVERRLFFDIRSNFTAIALMTDGITDPKFPTDHAFADPAQWMAFWEQDLGKAVQFSRRNQEIKRQFMDWMDFWSPGNHDDRTLAILVP